TGVHHRLALFEKLQEFAMPRQLRLAGFAAGQMGFERFLRFRRNLAVAVVRDFVGGFDARHTNVSRLILIFWVARNRQFLAASSVVPIMSPIARSRKPS